MKRTLRVFVRDAPIGLLHYDGHGSRESAAFEYVSDWLRDPARFTIDPALQLVLGPQFHRKTQDGSIFHGALSDTEPDGWGRRIILRDHAKRRERDRRAGTASTASPLTSLDYLLAVDDHSRVGALRFQDETGVFRRAPEPGRTTPPVLELAMLFAATRAVETHSETLADLEYLRGRGTSLGGLRPKCTIVDDDGQLAIGKFPSVQDERAVTKGEVLALRLAARARIDAAAARIVDADGTPVAVIHRFDRDTRGNRFPYVSAATLLGVDPHDGLDHAYTEIVDALRRHGAVAQQDTDELWRRIAFSILINNVDDHLLNHGFLHAHGDLWRLSPAFDINPFPERQRELKTWISEDSGPDARLDSLMRVAKYFRIANKRAKEILAEVVAATGRWRTEGRATGMTSAELDQFADAFEHDERTAAKQLIARRSP